MRRGSTGMDVTGFKQPYQNPSCPPRRLPDLFRPREPSKQARKRFYSSSSSTFQYEASSTRRNGSHSR
ncbi:hypothetical protein SAMN05444354_112161 [Stigmatella aurantiaca]|uniref:Uncharacterized protein n=1 Tax=Stigmatella aurantiaca TaxID=41 RepID=A0A1H7W563_STIAU|nr:hypothetical protein SAMN05444354_112161 [Stigmatella aurantiaca]